MNTIIVFIDGTICDTRHRHHLYESAEFNSDEMILKDSAVPGSIDCLQELASCNNIIYMGARDISLKAITEKWLKINGYPPGEIYLSEHQEERLHIVQSLKETNHIVAGIGDRWDDNELHLEIGCLSIILEEFKGNWNTVRKYLINKGGQLPIM